jgi:sugar phosphate isomerase/epimerase
MLERIDHPNFGMNLDPSHIHRAGENPVEALGGVIDRIRHVHIRDCLGREKGPGEPHLQTCGRGEIDLLGYVRKLHEHGYEGALDLEVIGASKLDLPSCVAVAAASRGHMQACLQACGAR